MTGFDPVQVPDWQVSVCVHALPSLQAVPLAAFGFEQTPVEVLQVPATWHWWSAVQTTGFEPMQVPDWQVSVCVHVLPSLLVVQLAASGFEPPPVHVVLALATWHWSSAVQTTGFAPVQVSDWQVSVCVHALPSLQAVPLAAFGFEHI